jgi:hypothetical protein
MHKLSRTSAINFLLHRTSKISSKPQVLLNSRVHLSNQPVHRTAKISSEPQVLLYSKVQLSNQPRPLKIRALTLQTFDSKPPQEPNTLPSSLWKYSKIRVENN